MFNKLYPVMMSVIALFIFSDTQSMNKRQEITKAEAEKQRFELSKAKEHGKAFHDLHLELMEQDTDRAYEDSLNKLEKRLEKQRARNIQLGLHVGKFDDVLVELDALELKWINREYTNECVSELDMNRDIIFLRLIKDIHVNLNSIKEEKNKFMAVLAELKRHDNSEEEQLGESSVGLQEFFGQEFASTQASKDEAATQEAAFAQLTQSIVNLEQSVQDIPELFGQDEKSVEQMQAIEPVKVGLLTKLSDWWYGPSNLVNELSSEKISLDTLKKSPDMQKRINGMIARHSLTAKTDVGTLSALVGIYTALDTLNFKFVDVEVNTALYNACKTLLAEKRNKYTDTREARIFAIAKYITSELNKMVAEQDPHAQAIAKLEELERLIGKVGMVEVTAEDKVPYQSEPVVLEMIGNLEKLSLALTVAEEAEKAATK